MRLFWVICVSLLREPRILSINQSNFHTLTGGQQTIKAYSENSSVYVVRNAASQ